MATNTITINGKKFTISNNSQLSGLSCVFMVKALQVYNGTSVHYDGISQQDAKLLADAGSEAVEGILSGIQAIAEIMPLINLEEVSTANLNSLAYLLSGLAEMGIKIKSECNNLTLYANN